MDNGEKLAELFNDSTSSVEDIVTICERMVAIDSLAREKLSGFDDVPFLIRAFGIAILVDSLAKGYELDISSLSELIGIPRPTVHRWVKKMEENGTVKFVRKGQRKVITVNQLHPQVIDFFDTLARKFKIPEK